MFLFHILQDILNEKGDGIFFDGKSVREYVEEQGAVHALHELAISGVGDLSVLAADLVFVYFQGVALQIETVQHVLAELGLSQYANQFAEFGIEYGMLPILDLPVVEALIPDLQDRHIFLQWKYSMQAANCRMGHFQ